MSSESLNRPTRRTLTPPCEWPRLPAHDIEPSRSGVGLKRPFTEVAASSMESRIGLSGTALACLFMTACSLLPPTKTVYPTILGGHAQPELNAKRARTIVVWSSEPVTGNTLVAELVAAGLQVVERARLQEVLNEQKIRLTNTPGDNADILRAGRLIGADRVVFADVTNREEMRGNASVGTHGGSSSSWSAYHLAVALRGVDVESGMVRWFATGTYPEAISNPDQGLMRLTVDALSRALCPIESGYKWVERTASSEEESGCTKNGKHVRLSESKEDPGLAW